MAKKPIEAPPLKAVGPYSLAVEQAGVLFVSGQIPLDPATGQLVEGAFEVHARRVFENLKALAVASGGTLADVAKLNVFLTDLGNFAEVNRIMAEYFTTPYPARAALGVAALPRGSVVEMDAILVLA